MKWFDHAPLVDQLASAYVLGTLQGPARRRFETVYRSNRAVQSAVQAWVPRLGPMLTSLSPVEPSSLVWARIADRAGLQVARVPLAWWRKWLAPIPAAALLLGTLLGGLGPTVWQMQVSSNQQNQLPESYAGVLATADGKPGLVVSSLRHGTIVDIKQVAPVVLAPGQSLYLWRIDKLGLVTPIAEFPNGKNVQLKLSQSAETVFFSAVELAVSLEPTGAQPTQPSSGFVYRGLCGKLWHWSAN